MPLFGGPRIPAVAQEYGRGRARGRALSGGPLRRPRLVETPPEANPPMTLGGISKITGLVGASPMVFQLSTPTQLRAGKPIGEEGDDPWLAVPRSSRPKRPHNALGVNVAMVGFPIKGSESGSIGSVGRSRLSVMPCDLKPLDSPVELHFKQPGLPQTVKEGDGEPHSRYQEGDIRVYDVSSSGISRSVRQGFVLKTGELVRVYNTVNRLSQLTLRRSLLSSPFLVQERTLPLCRNLTSG